MKRNNTMSTGTTTGLDVGDRFTHVCIIDRSGRVVRSFKIRTTKAGFGRAFVGKERSRCVLEVGTHSPWISRLLSGLGHEVLVANSRRVRLIAESHSKNDRADAEMLARLGRLDPDLLSAITHRGERAQRHLILLRARDGLVRARTMLVNQVRGFVKGLGQRCPSSSTPAFTTRVRESIGEEFYLGMKLMLEAIDRFSADIRQMNRQIEELCRTEYPETEALREVKGVGAITALCFVLTIEDPHRFTKSRTVGAYLGLRSRQRESSDWKPQLPITKAGDRMLRRLLVTSAHYVLGPFGPDTELRRFGLRLAERGGTSAKKRAVVAVARKLAVLLHRLWVTGEVYEPLGYGKEAEATA